ncbi:MAG TPA: ATP-binding protein, partial [Hyphomicrobiaceae bacterium]|nr:ATP-binding protein [Hyphomicrobiaceae bacterium]
MISGYRCFRYLEMGGLGQVNLLVGRNNSGKTSVLEALYLLASGGEPTALWRIVNRRGERLDLDAISPNRTLEVELDISHLFHGHDMRPTSKFTVQTKNSAHARSISYSIQEAAASDQMDFDRGELPLLPRSVLSLQGSPKPLIGRMTLSARGGLRLDGIDQRPRRGRAERRTSAQYITTESLSVDDLIVMWNDIVLTDSEERVLTALRFLEPKIERLAATAGPTTRYYSLGTRDGFKVKIRNVETPIPIGSLGDGMWRILALAISLIRAKDGVLLVDEIDTGLHYSVMTNMWDLVYHTAREFNVQVFATTHSYDCVQSLASVCGPGEGRANNVT